jgi:hypothetical protein
MLFEAGTASKPSKPSPMFLPLHELAVVGMFPRKADHKSQVGWSVDGFLASIVRLDQLCRGFITYLCRFWAWASLVLEPSHR